jgi:hypothetical protein
MAESVFRYRFWESKKLLLIFVLFAEKTEFLCNMIDPFISERTGKSVSLFCTLIGEK